MEELPDYIDMCYGISWSTSSGSMSILHLMVGLVSVLEVGLKERFILTRGPRHDQDMNPVLYYWPIS